MYKLSHWQRPLSQSALSNLICVVGAKEEAGKTVTVRRRDDPDHQSQMTLDEFQRHCRDMVREFK